MAPAIDIEEVEAVYSEAPEDRTELGLLEWHTIFDTPVDRPTLEDAFRRAGLEEKWLPQPIQMQDVYRRKTNIRRKKLPTEDSGEIFANYYVTEVASTKEFIVRMLVKDTVDAGNIQLSHEDVGKFILHRKDQKVEFEAFGEINVDLIEYIQDLVTNFESYCKIYNGKIIREIVRAILYSTRTVSLKDHGGVYFVPRQHKDLVYKLKDMIDILQEDNPEKDRGKRSSIKAVTLMNKAQERIVIKETIEDHVKERIGGLQDFITQMAQVLQANGTIKQKEVGNYLKEAKDLAMTVKQYEDLLEDDLNSLRSGVEVIKGQLQAMLAKVEE